MEDIMKVSRVSEMKTLDHAAVEQFGLTAELLMENAGQAAYQVLAEQVGVHDRRFLVFCGTNNNGGIGLVLARKIHSDGGIVKVFILGDVSKFKGAVKFNFDIVSRLPIELKQIETLDMIHVAVSDFDLIVDALLGVGISRDVEGLYHDVIDLLNSSSRPVLSLDIPSGVNGDTGKIMGAAVQADYTVTFGLPKVGNILFPGYVLCGKLYVSHISFPPELYTSDSLKIAINTSSDLPPRNISGHKGSFGDVLFIAGAANYFGAPYFAAASFLKAGGGYSRLAAPASITPFIASKASEIVFVPQQETTSGSIALTNKYALLKLSKKVDMVVLGPGLSLNEETQQLVQELAQEIEKPLLIDGDGITAIGKDLSILKDRKAETILTPHLGEMSRITHKSVSEIDERKIDILQQTAKELHAIIVLKGAHSLIGDPDERIFINLTGNSGMATAGSGDVLTGTIAAMYGLGLSILEAVQKGVFMHGFAGDLAAADKGEDGITAQDILDYLPCAVKLDREGLNDKLRERYRGVFVV
jgi:hydroxyethylthiazole kinase-like uncharacterized protein yjeF